MFLIVSNIRVQNYIESKLFQKGVYLNAMKASELRLGNYVFKDGVVVKVDGRSIFDISSREYDTGFLLPYEPIPLTTEWLRKFKFTETEDYLYMSEKGPVFKLDGVNILYYRGEFSYGVEIWDGGSGEEWSFVTDINYVHQLQNLYFALTYKELQA